VFLEDGVLVVVGAPPFRIMGELKESPAETSREAPEEGFAGRRWALCGKWWKQGSRLESRRRRK